MTKLGTIFIFGFCLFFIPFSYCQLTNGSIAPDWTLTDIDGNQHHLYTYLNDGKTVFLDFSATWCDPCWIYQNRNHLDQLHAQYGPDGTDEVRVLFIEGDPWTTFEDLQGTGPNTLGNWINNTTYPIIDDPSITGLYEVTYWPTIYKICPNKRIEEVGTISTSALYACVDRCTPPTGTNNAAIFSYNGEDGYFCRSKTINPSVTIQNEGNELLSSCLVDFKCNNLLIQTISWSGALPSFQTKNITFDPYTAYEDVVFEFELRLPNGQNDEDSEYNVLSGVQLLAPKSGHMLDLSLHTDFWPKEMSWTLSNEAGAILYQNSDFPPLQSDAQYDYSFFLPNEGCHTFSIRDSFGDGLLNGPVGGGVYAKGSISLESEGVILWNDIDYAFGTDIHFEVMEIVSDLEEDLLLENSVSLYPNPAREAAQLSFALQSEAEFQITIADLQGRTLRQLPIIKQAAGQHSILIDLEGLDQGLYILTINGDRINRSLKFVVGK